MPCGVSPRRQTLVVLQDDAGLAGFHAHVSHARLITAFSQPGNWQGLDTAFGRQQTNCPLFCAAQKV
jgi:hypothetical protein